MIGSSFSLVNQPIYNFAPTGAVGGGVRATVASNADQFIIGLTSVQVTVNATGYFPRVVDTFDVSTIPGGQTLTISTWYKSSSTTGRIACQFFPGANATGTPLATFDNPAVTGSDSGSWVRLIQGATVPAGAASMQLWRGFTDSTAIGVSGLFTAPMVTIGPTAYPFADGTFPAWQWTAATGTSASHGYPYTLESIAGAPLASVSTPGGSAPLTLGAFEGRTLYLVHDVMDTSANLMSLASIGSSISAGGGTMVIRTGSTSSVYLENRPQTNNGTPIFVDAAGARTVGRHVSSATASNGATSASICVDGGTITTLALTPGIGFTTNPLLNLAAVTASDIPVYAVAYQGEHDAITRSRVTAWLARAYGGTIPAGY